VAQVSSIVVPTVYNGPSIGLLHEIRFVVNNKRKEVRDMDQYEAPELLPLGEAEDLVLGSSNSNNDCCTCGKSPKAPPHFDLEE
jgi:hypothetical protein